MRCVMLHEVEVDAASTVESPSVGKGAEITGAHRWRVVDAGPRAASLPSRVRHSSSTSHSAGFSRGVFLRQRLSVQVRLVGTPALSGRRRSLCRLLSPFPCFLHATLSQHDVVCNPTAGATRVIHRVTKVRVMPPCCRRCAMNRAISQHALGNAVVDAIARVARPVGAQVQREAERA